MVDYFLNLATYIPTKKDSYTTWYIEEFEACTGNLLFTTWCLLPSQTRFLCLIFRFWIWCREVSVVLLFYESRGSNISWWGRRKWWSGRFVRIVIIWNEKGRQFGERTGFCAHPWQPRGQNGLENEDCDISKNTNGINMHIGPVVLFIDGHLRIR